MFTQDQKDQLLKQPLVQAALQQLIAAASAKGETVDTGSLIDQAIEEGTKGIDNPEVKAVTVWVTHCLLAKLAIYADTHEAKTKIGHLLRQVFGFLYPHHTATPPEAATPPTLTPDTFVSGTDYHKIDSKQG